MDTKIKALIAKLPEPKRSLALKLRGIILAADKSIDEAIKWNQLTFTCGKDNVCFVYTYASVDYINLGFMNAVHLSDPKKLFEGTGKGMRHIKIRTEKDIPAMQVKKWVKEAVKLYLED